MRWVANVVSSFQTGNFGQPGFYSFVYAVSLATASYIGIESISQAAEETKRTAQVIPKATKAAILSVVVVAVALSLLSVTITPWQVVANNSQAPAVTLASNLPIISGAFAVWVALMGTLVCYVSTNTGVIGVSRVMYSMGRLGLMPRGFSKVSSRYRTPYVTITIFTVIASLLLAVYIALPGADLLDLITSIYNFGALVAYMYVNAAAIVLRVKEPGRTGWKMPLNLTVRIGDKPYQVSVIPVVGLVSSFVVWVLIVGLHPTGRVVGTVWFAIGIAAYLIYQRYRGGSKDG